MSGTKRSTRTSPKRSAKSHVNHVNPLFGEDIQSVIRLDKVLDVWLHIRLTFNDHVTDILTELEASELVELTLFLMLVEQPPDYPPHRIIVTAVDLSWCTAWWLLRLPF